MQNPISIPKPIVFGENYYLDRKNDFEKRYPTKEAPSYYLSFGDKYLRRFINKVRKKLSLRGQKWVDDVHLLLQQELEKGILSNPSLELAPKRFAKYAYQTHIKAYLAAGILELPVKDKVKILLAIDFKDFLIYRGTRLVFYVLVKSVLTFR